MDMNLIEIFSVFMVLFAVIDIPGSIPIIIDIKEKVGNVDPLKASLSSLLLMLIFLFGGEPFLKVFGVDVGSFAIAGSFVLFFIGVEMVLGVEIFKYEAMKGASIVPIAFPLIAGAGSFTALLSLKSEYSTVNILIGLVLNMVLVYIVIKATSFFERILGITGIHILKRFFGIILLAIAVKLFLSNTGIQLPVAK